MSEKLPDGWTCGTDGFWSGPDGASATIENVDGGFMTIMYAPWREDPESARSDLLLMAEGLAEDPGSTLTHGGDRG